MNSTPIRQNGEASDGVNDSSINTKKRPLRAGSKLRIEWSKQSSRMTRLGGLAYFTEFLELTGLFDDLVFECPLTYTSNNAPNKRDVLGVMLLSVLSGQTRYAHMSSLSGGRVDADLLGMKKIPCEDSIRGAMWKLVTQAQAAQDKSAALLWLKQSFDRLCSGALKMPWVLDVDVTVKPLYGKQEGAVLGYNPQHPGRPSHAYHSFWVGHLRLCLEVQVRPGNETAGSHGLGSLLDWFERHPSREWPDFVRGDIGYGTQKWMLELELLGIAYLFKLKQTRGVKDLVRLSELQSDWESSLGTWECCEATLQLSGWTCSRRVVIYRRIHHKKGSKAKVAKALNGPVEANELLQLELIEEDAFTYEYAIYVTSLCEPATEIRALYNPRGDNENCYDELKNQWGWGGFTLKDLPRSELMARFIALIYNWWSIYVKLVDEKIAREAITSRPLFLFHNAKVSTHQSICTLVGFCAHVETERIQRKLEQAARRLKEWATLTAEQLELKSVWARIITHILTHHKTVGSGNSRDPPMITNL